MDRLSFEHFLLIAEAALRVSYDELERVVCFFRAQSALAAPFVCVYGVHLITDPVERAAICAWLLLRFRPIPLGRESNSKVAFECMREMLLLSGCRWSRPEEGAEEVGETLEGVEAGEIDLAEFIRWVRSRIAS